MIETIIDISLYFSHTFIIISLLILVYLLVDRDLSLQAASILLITILINNALKASFAIPLSPHLNKVGFAFPSGHMQASFALYGWLFWKIKNLYFRIFAIFILTMIGYGLVYKNYHNYFDVLGAIFFGMITLVIYNILLNINRNRLILIINPIFATILVIYISLIDKMRAYGFLAYAGIIIITISCRIIDKFKRNIYN